MIRGLQMFSYPILLITMYSMMGLLLYNSWDKYDVTDIVILLIGVYVSSVYVNYIYHYIKYCERMRGRFFRVKQCQVIRQLAKSMAHAIRNPLTAAKGFLQLVSLRKLITEQTHKYCKHAESGIKEADGVITDYLRCVEPEIKIPHHLHVQAEIDEKIIPRISPICKQPQVKIITRHLTKEPLYIEGQPDMFVQTVLNIVTNAVEAMPAGGKLEVTTWLEGESVYIHVEDTGIGMSMQEIKRIGTPFYDTRTKGTGLGLMVVLSLVQAMNGTISYYSRPKEGTKCLLKYKNRGGKM